ncbi:MAG TPA: biopolymer transporter ExbD [Pyrinomonadaceae bacterium]
MGMSAGGGSGLNSEINVTPMVDIMLVLLIIFILVTPNLQQGVSVDLPKETSSAREDQAIASKDSIVISVKQDKDTKQGRFYLGETEYQIGDPTNAKDAGRTKLAAILKQELEKKEDAKRIVYIKADIDADYGNVVGIIDLIRSEEAGNTRKIGLVADRKREVSETTTPVPD